MNKKEISLSLESLHPFEVECLKILQQMNLKSISTINLDAQSSFLDLNKSNRAINWLKDKRYMTVESHAMKSYKLTKEGKVILNNGLPELRLLIWIQKNNKTPMKTAIDKSNLSRQEFNIALGVLKRNQHIQIDKGNLAITDSGVEGIDSLKKDEKIIILGKIKKNNLNITKNTKFVINNLLKRGLVEELTSKINSGTLTSTGVSLRDNISQISQVEDKLTSEMLTSGKWESLRLRPFDIEISTPPVHTGKRHFYWQAIDYVRQVWLSLGFKEMEGTIVQSSFWNFGALFVPQDHPARDSQDTFYIKNPSKGKINDLDYENVSQTHLNGGNTGSTGWRGSFEREISETLVLRTHTTCLSARTLKKIKEDGYPAKYFAVGRNFRNEKVDWKHLAEFDQVEGIVVDPDVTFPDLLGYLRIFFKAMGFPQARFRPSFYPYTEPSVGIDVFHPIKKAWVELGGAGVFRPECVEPILGEDIPVLAWGPGIGRIIQDQYNIVDIREQYFNDLDQLKKSPLWML